MIDREYDVLRRCREHHEQNCTECPCLRCVDNSSPLHEELDRLRARVTDLEKALDEAKRSKEHTEYWYAVRIERIKDLAKEKGIWHEVAAILANGTVGVHEPPTYAQQLNAAIHRANTAEQGLEDALAEHDALVECINESLPMYAYDNGDEGEPSIQERVMYAGDALWENDVHNSKLRAERAEAERDQAQHHLDEFQGTCADLTLRLVATESERDRLRMELESCANLMRYAWQSPTTIKAACERVCEIARVALSSEVK